MKRPESVAARGAASGPRSISSFKTKRWTNGCRCSPPATWATPLCNAIKFTRSRSAKRSPATPPKMHSTPTSETRQRCRRVHLAPKESQARARHLMTDRKQRRPPRVEKTRRHNRATLARLSLPNLPFKYTLCQTYKPSPQRAGLRASICRISSPSGCPERPHCDCITRQRSHGMHPFGQKFSLT